MSINQPAYLPWLGYFHRIAASDKHIVLDHVQFEKNSFVNRNRVRCGSAPAWLTVPVKTKGLFGELPITDLEIDTRQDWQTKHWRTISQQYRKAPYFHEYEPFFADVYARTWTHLVSLCEYITGYLLRQFGITTPLVTSSQFQSQAKKNDLVLELCRKLGAETYLSGPLGRAYLVEEQFAAAGIRVVYQTYHHPVYTQTSPAFQPNLAAIDLLFNCGPRARAVLMDGQEAYA